MKQIGEADLENGRFDKLRNRYSVFQFMSCIISDQPKAYNNYYCMPMSVTRSVSLNLSGVFN